MLDKKYLKLKLSYEYIPLRRYYSDEKERIEHSLVEI
jgi:hypothetical protein